MIKKSVALVIVFSFLLYGCGYKTASLLPEGIKTIFVSNFENKIDPAREISDRRSNYSYWPGLETSITRAVIDGFIFDRHLEVQRENNSDLILKGTLIDFRQTPLSYSGDDTVDEFRVEVFVDLELYDQHTGQNMWMENGFMGQSSYSITGPNEKTEAQAVKNAVDDLAQRIVERTVEAW